MRPDAYCGLYCGACEVMAANRRGTVADVAREWGRSEEELRCDGCKTDVLAVYCRDCTFRACARGKGVEFCSECGDYPCKALLAFRDDKAPITPSWCTTSNGSRLLEAGPGARSSVPAGHAPRAASRFPGTRMRAPHAAAM